MTPPPPCVPDVTELEHRIRVGGLLAAGRPVIVMYSGGRDSTCLLDLAARIAGPPVVTALHVNYRLREAAQADERHCVRTCAVLGVPIVVRRADDRPRRGNLQAWARDLRHAAAYELADAHGADVASGHTATDQVETILYRLASSPSRRALLGMRPRDDSQPARVRPLLDVTRAQTGEYCRARGLAWCEDETNATGTYARGRVRHGLVPALEAIHPAAQANVLSLARTLREEAAVLDEIVDAVLGGGSEIALVTLQALAPALRRLVVQRLADEAAGGPAAGAARRADEVAHLAQTGTAALDLPGGVRATARRGVVTFAPTPPLPAGRGWAST